MVGVATVVGTVLAAILEQGVLGPCDDCYQFVKVSLVLCRRALCGGRETGCQAYIPLPVEAYVWRAVNLPT